MEIQYHRIFYKKFKKLPMKVQDEFKERLVLFINNKFDKRLNNHLVDFAYMGCRSINVTGDYRAIFRDEGDVVTFINIGTHSQLYQ